MADAGEHGNVLVADEARQVVVIEPSQIVDRAAAADQCDRIGRRPLRKRFQGLHHRGDDLPRCAFPLEPAVGIDEAADPKAFQPLRLLPEIPQPCRILGRHHEHAAVVPGRLLAPVVLEHPLALQPLPDLALARLQVPERVLGIDGIDLQAETVLRMEHRPRQHQQLDARADDRACGLLEFRQDARGRRAPDHGPGFGNGLAVAIALGQL